MSAMEARSGAGAVAWLACLAVGAVCPWTCHAAQGGDLQYIDGRRLPIEGKAFADTPTYYERLPSAVPTNVNGLARMLARHAAGLQFRFRTDSDVLEFKWTMRRDFELADVRGDDNMTGILAAGIDVYRQREDGSWGYAATGRPGKGLSHSFRMAWRPGCACLVYLPCYGAVADFQLGVRQGAKVEEVPRTGVAKPVVFYGTSITQGGCASRPGLAWVSQVGRALDVPVVNLGFSGSGRMEPEMADQMAAIDASCYVLDCIANMRARAVGERVEPFVRRLRAAKPDVPIVLAERTIIDEESVTRNAVLRDVYDRLVRSGAKGLFYVPANRLLPADGEGLADGGHPNDLGMKTIADAFSKAVRSALSRPADAIGRQHKAGPGPAGQ